MSKQDKIFLKQKAKELEDIITPQLDQIPMSRPKIRFLVNKLKDRPLRDHLKSLADKSQ